MTASHAPRRLLAAPLLWLSTLTLALAAAGCAQLPSDAVPRSQLRDAASVGLAAAPTDAAAFLTTEWWRDLGDAQLDQLVAQALADHPTLRIAQARLARARATADIAGSALLPQVNGSLDVTHQKYTANGAIPAPLAGSIRDSGTLQLGASWELDLFGKNRAALEAAVGAARASEADVQFARLMLSTEVVRSYVKLARLHDQLEVARRTLAQREETLGLVRDRLQAGLDTHLELRQSEGGLPEARQQIESLEEQAVSTRNALAALAGQPTLAASLQAPALGSLKAQPLPGTLPADLLGRRPDVVAARWRAEASAREVDNARAQFYPNINLTAFAGLSSIGLGRLIDSGSQQWGVGPAIRLPIFEGGRLRANLRGKAADLDAAVETYNATVLYAVQDTADQVSAAQSIARQQDEQRKALSAAEDAYDIARQRYKAGLGNYLQVLTAETRVLSARGQGVDLAARALDNRVLLARALGGGYQADDATRQLAASSTAAGPSAR